MASNKGSLFLSLILLVLVILLSFYQWNLLAANKLLSVDIDTLKFQLTKLDDDRQNLQNQKAELTTNLENKKRYISDVDGKFIEMKEQLSKCQDSLKGCGDEKNKIKQDNERLQEVVKQAEDARKAMEGQKQKTLTELEEFRTLCTVADMKQQLAIKLCPSLVPVVVPPK